MQYRKQGRPEDEWQRAARALCAAQDAFQTARQVLLQDEKGRPFGPLAEALQDEHAAYEAGWRAVRAAVQPEWPAACAALRMAAEALQDAAYDTATAFLGAHKADYETVTKHEAYRREWEPAAAAAEAVAAYKWPDQHAALQDANTAAEVETATDALHLAIAKNDPALSAFLTAEELRAFSVAIKYVAKIR